MLPWKNGNVNCICTVSEDGKTVEVAKKGVKTRITANPDGTLKLENINDKKSA